ncbi:MAG TPA: stalk domain-containing protein [Armatimonadota bacterium]|nr:stalk domain-containing protein [Armatimonadota bacterium]
MSFLKYGLALLIAGGAGSAGAAERKVITPAISPERHGGATYVPVGLIGATTGASLARHPARREVEIRRGERWARLRAGSRIALVNGRRMRLSLAPYLRDENLMVPLRLVADALDARVRYEEQTASLLVGPGPDDVLWTIPLETRRTGIVIHSPSPGAEPVKTIRVHGQANTPDAPVVVQLQDAEGRVLQESTLPRGNGVFREFQVFFAHAKGSGGVIPARVVAFSPSPQDGSPRRQVTIPVTLHLADPK